MSTSRRAAEPSLVIDTWGKAIGIGLTLAALVVSTILAFNTLLLAPLSARVERLEGDRVELVQRLTRIETKVDALLQSDRR